MSKFINPVDSSINGEYLLPDVYKRAILHKLSFPPIIAVV